MTKWLIGGCVLVSLACSACGTSPCRSNACAPQPYIVNEFTMPLNEADAAAKDGQVVTDQHGNTYRIQK